MYSSYPPPADSVQEFTALLEARVAAKQAQQAAQTKGDRKAITNAEWAVTEASGAILRFEYSQAGNWNRGLRFSIRHCRELLRAMLMELLGLDVLRDDIRQLRADTDEIIEAVANLEAQRKGVAL